MIAVRLGDELTISGPPRNVRALVPITVERSTVLPIAINMAGQLSVVRAVLRPFAVGASEIRLRLPDQTAPGVYHAEATIEGKARAIMLEVETQPRVRVQPSQTALSVQPASSEPFAVTILNGGNVPIDIPKQATFDLDDADGQERALGRSLRATLEPGEARVERFFNELRESHGGEARVVVRSGAGALAPGETREIACVLEVPESARLGRSYSGSFEIGPASHVIVADVMSSARPPKVRTAQ